MLNKLKELRDSREEGFTLIELLVVIVIIGVLAAIALPIFLNQQKAAIHASMKSDTRNAVTAVATMLVNNPTAVEGANDLTPFQDLIDNGKVGLSDGNTLFYTNFVEVDADNDNTIVDFGDLVPRWDSYAVYTANDGAPDLAYGFNSTTGKYFDIKVTA